MGLKLAYLSFRRAINRAWWAFLRGDFYGILLLAVLDVTFVLIWIGGWWLGNYLYFNEMISKNAYGVIVVLSLILSFPISFYLLVKVSNYLDSRGL